MVEALPILEADTRDTEAILAVAETRDTEAILEAGIREREAGIRGPAAASGKILDMVRAEEEVVGEAEGEALCWDEEAGAVEAGGREVRLVWWAGGAEDGGYAGDTLKFFLTDYNVIPTTKHRIIMGKKCKCVPVPYRPVGTQSQWYGTGSVFDARDTDFNKTRTLFDPSLWIRIHFLRIGIQLFFLMRIQI